MLVEDTSIYGEAIRITPENGIEIQVRDSYGSEVALAQKLSHSAFISQLIATICVCSSGENCSPFLQYFSSRGRRTKLESDLPSRVAGSAEKRPDNAMTVGAGVKGKL